LFFPSRDIFSILREPFIIHPSAIITFFGLPGRSNPQQEHSPPRPVRLCDPFFLKPPALESAAFFSVYITPPHCAQPPRSPSGRVAASECFSRHTAFSATFSGKVLPQSFLKQLSPFLGIANLRVIFLDYADFSNGLTHAFFGYATRAARPLTFWRPSLPSLWNPLV